MITTTITLATHMLTSTFRLLGPVTQVLEYVLPYATMASRNKINFDTKHLKKGDPLPPYNGKLRVYNMRYCPYAQRTILALNAKNVDYEVININLSDKPEWLTSKSQFGKVPAIEVKDGVVIYESLVTVEYLDEVYPERPLIPKDPLLKAYDKIIIEATTPIFALFYKLIRSPDEVTDDHVAKYQGALDFVQCELVRRDTKFLDGSQPGFADYMIWPWFERVLTVVDLFPSLTIDASKYARLLSYLNDMLQDEVVSQYIVPKEILIKYFEGYKSGSINYDIMHKE